MTEKNEILRDGARPQKNSGRGKIQKGDAILGEFCYDIKEYGKSFSISRDVWAKICLDAYQSGGKTPALKVVLGESNSKVRLWVLEDSVFHDMRRAWEGRYGE